MRSPADWWSVVAVSKLEQLMASHKVIAEKSRDSWNAMREAQRLAGIARDAEHQSADAIAAELEIMLKLENDTAFKPVKIQLEL